MRLSYDESTDSLYIELRINGEDSKYLTAMPNDVVHVSVRRKAKTITVIADEHFHSGKPKVYKIIVNGRQKEVSTKTLSFDQVVALAFNPAPSGPNVQFTVTYRKGPSKNPHGSMTEGESVRIKDGMIFDVTETNKS